MITLIHGENQLTARSKFRLLLSDYKKKGYEIVRLDPGKEIKPQLTSNSLFSDNVVFVGENIKKVPELESSIDLLLLYDQEIGVTILKTLPKDTKIEKFDIPKTLFKFIDNIYPKNKNLLTSFHELIKNEPKELVFAMIGRQLRDLYWIKSDPVTLSYPSWRLSNLKRQSDHYDEQKLKELIGKLAVIDFKSKVGEANLETSLDLLIASELK